MNGSIILGCPTNCIKINDPKNEAKKTKGIVSISYFLSYKRMRNIEMMRIVLVKPMVLTVRISRIIPENNARGNNHSAFFITVRHNINMKTRGIVVTVPSRTRIARNKNQNPKYY